MAVLFDSATASSARKRSLPAYKQNRFCPDDLRIQFAKAKEALNELGYRWMCSETHEADDLIATCVRAQPEDRFVKIASKDKDLLQLVNKKARTFCKSSTYACVHSLSLLAMRFQVGLRWTSRTVFLP
eukprot:g15678.t1